MIRSITATSLLCATVVAAFLTLIPAQAQSAVRCFGHAAKVLNQSRTYRLARHEAVYVNARARIVGKGDNRICAGRHSVKLSLGKGAGNRVRLGSGNDVIRATGPTGNTYIDAGSGDNRILVNAKARSHTVKTGNGNDRISIGPRAKASNRTIVTGLGSDRVAIRAKGNTRAILSERRNPRRLPDNDIYSGGRSNDTVDVYHGRNTIYGKNGSDTIRSMGTAVSFIVGANGSDKIFSNGGDEILGGRGQDQLHADRGGPLAPVLIDGGPGDDTITGTDLDDTLIGATGSDKMSGNGGDDIMRGDEGANFLNGGSGEDTVSYAAHTRPGYGETPGVTGGGSGVKVDLVDGDSLGGGYSKLTSIENVIGSSFDDLIETHPRRPNRVWAGLGDDEIEAHRSDFVDGGLGRNQCSGTDDTENCGPSARRDPKDPVVSLTQDGVLTVLGGNRADELVISRTGSNYAVHASRPLDGTDDNCTIVGGRASCAARRVVNLLAFGGPGDDAITVDNSVPAGVSTILDGGDGSNVVVGGNTSDFIFDGKGDSKLYGRGGSDIIEVSASGSSQVFGGPGHDVAKIPNPCLGHTIRGGKGKDNVIFAPSPRAVEVSLGGGYAKWRNASGCNATSLAGDIRGAEGTRYDDLLIGSPRSNNGFLGRQGADTFYTRHGTRDSIITGPGRKKRLIVDRHDKVVRGWGHAGR